VAVDAIASWCDIVVAEIPLDGFLGFLRRGKRTGILMKEGQGFGQRRFTLAHELGHFCLPTHARVSAFCLDESVSGSVADLTIEREANRFAAELLMPSDRYRLDVTGVEPSFRTVERLAAPDRYGVSITASAIRLVELTDEACALICTCDGRVLWRTLSRNFFHSLPAPRNPIRPQTAAAAVIRGENASETPEKVPVDAWFMPKSEITEVFESTLVVPTLGQVLSLVWVPATDWADPDQE
jgi:hypothetical protein